MYFLSKRVNCLTVLSWDAVVQYIAKFLTNRHYYKHSANKSLSCYNIFFFYKTKIFEKNHKNKNYSKMVRNRTTYYMEFASDSLDTEDWVLYSLFCGLDKDLSDTPCKIRIVVRHWWSYSLSSVMPPYKYNYNRII